MKKRFIVIAISLAVFSYANLFSQNFAKVTRANQNQTINLAVNQVLEIQLPERPSNGYSWVEAATLSDKTQKTISKAGEDDFIPDTVIPLPNNNKHFIGQVSTQIIRYIGVSEGPTVLTLELRRPWLKNGEVMDSYTITVVSEGEYTGAYKPQLKAIHKLEKPLTSGSSALPSRWDWRPRCTPIENQNMCGDCWAYASVGTLECNISIHDGVTEDISEEFVTDCYTNNGCSGCNGGYCAHQAWMASYTGANSSGGGAIYESEDPTTCNNTGVTGICGEPYAPHEAIDNYADIGGENSQGIPPVDSIKYHIYNHGPVWIALYAASSAWHSYTGGILAENESYTGGCDHAVDLVGWSDTAVADNSGGYWILRNSWGTSWGMSGYMYITYASDLIGTYADYIDYKGGTPHSLSVSLYASPNSICLGDTTQLEAMAYGDSNYVYSWTSSPPGFSSVIKNPKVAPTATTKYVVSVTCDTSIVSDSITIIVHSKPTLNISPSVNPICKGNSTILTASGAKNYLWSGGYGNTSAVLVKPDSATVYTVTGTDINGCRGEKSDTIYVNPDPAVPTIAQSGDLLTSSAAVGYQWFWNDTLIIWATSQSYTIKHNGSYTVEVTNSFGCKTMSAPYVMSNAGIEKYDFSDYIHIYPNPSTNNIAVECPVDVTIDILNVQGQLISKLQVYGGRTNYFDVSVFPSGVYIVKGKTEKGICLIKFIKE
jgi:predicted secreted protein